MRGFLAEFLKVYPYVPPQALWRAIEAELLCSLDIKAAVLDLGCGDGSFSQITYASRYRDFFGTDLSYNSLLMAKKRRIYNSITVSDACHLPYKDNTFATIICNCVIEHIPNDKGVVEEVARILRKNGTFVFTVPSDNFVANLMKQDKAYVNRINRTLEHYHYRSPQEWTRILREFDLEIIDSRYYLPAEVQRTWEVMTSFLIKGFMGYKVYDFLASRKLGIYFLLRLIVPSVFGRLLKKWCSMGVIDDKEGGASLFVAQKRG